VSINLVWNQFSNWIMQAGLPTVAVYHALCSSTFLNIAAGDAEGIEKIANFYLAPVQYLLAGKQADPVFSETGELISYRLKQRFSYEDPLIWVKTLGAYCALPSSLIIGSTLKGVSYAFEGIRQKAQKISTCLMTAPIISQNESYLKMGIELIDFDQAEQIESQGYQRRPGDELKLQAEKQALKEIVSLLNEHKIVYWLDCGTCLGAYRYGGNIPWDWDLDLAILKPDFANVRQILQKLDPNKYVVQDWSSRDKTESYLKVYVKEGGSLIDIYHFVIDPESKIVHSIVSNEDSIFLPESWKIRERSYTVPSSFDIVFPLKKISFDGVLAYVPNKTKTYLEQRYSGDISPARVYSQETGQYEKVPDHPYWNKSSR
jgi:hypothetical protein